MREKRVCRPYSPSSILRYPEGHWSLLSETVPVGFCLIWRPIGQAHIYWSKASLHISNKHVCGKLSYLITHISVATTIFYEVDPVLCKLGKLNFSTRKETREHALIYFSMLLTVDATLLAISSS